MVLKVQKGYVYLDNIFSSEDIRKQLPNETEIFDKLTYSWKLITSNMAVALEATHEPRKYFFLLYLFHKLPIYSFQLYI